MQQFQDNNSNPPNEENKEDINLNEIEEKSEKIDKEKKEEIKVKKNSIKRNPFEKTIDDSISILNSIISDEVNKNYLTFFFIYNITKDLVIKLINRLEKEIMKKEDFFKLIKVYEKIKQVRTFRHNIFNFLEM